MNEHAMKTLEYDKVKEQLKQYALSPQTKETIDRLQPSCDINVIQSWMDETTEARHILDKNASVPIMVIERIHEILSKPPKGLILSIEELVEVHTILECVKRLKKFMHSMEPISPNVAAYARSMFELTDLYNEIEKCIVNGRVDDRASAGLSRIRKKLTVINERIKQKMGSILSSPVYSKMLQEAVVNMRNGRYVVPVKREYRKDFEGSVLDTSASGSTLFIEPAGIAKLQEELNILSLEEENEVYRILCQLTGIIEQYAKEISINAETILHYDFVFAKGKHSRALQCSPVDLNTTKKITIHQGKHPLIGRNAVPLDFYIGNDYRALVITGPNTGGKTVVLKSVGLMTLMVQSGLHVPVQEDSEFAVFTDILVDIGDGQSIEQSLSTFSSHVKNLSTIIECAGENTLVIMDELGAGTDPGEGMGFAIAVVEEVFRKGSTILATTHYSEIKTFAHTTPGFKNGCMEFDVESLMPLYRLQIGQPGESNAFLIALRLGVKRQVIERAYEITYKQKVDYSSFKNLNTHRVVDTTTIQSYHTTVSQIKEVQKNRAKCEEQKRPAAFNIGDCVYISSMDRTGIVCELENNKGEVVVMVMKKKFRINKKRLTLHIEGKELYPENYDFDVIFESKEDRKKRKLMNKRHISGVIIEKQ